MRTNAHTYCDGYAVGVDLFAGLNPDVFARTRKRMYAD